MVRLQDTISSVNPEKKKLSWKKKGIIENLMWDGRSGRFFLIFPPKKVTQSSLVKEDGEWGADGLRSEEKALRSLQ